MANEEWWKSSKEEDAQDEKQEMVNQRIQDGIRQLQIYITSNEALIKFEEQTIETLNDEISKWLEEIENLQTKIK